MKIFLFFLFLYFVSTSLANTYASSPCLNGGTYQNDNPPFRCSCPPGYNARCEKDPCASSPCQNMGQCTSQGQTYNCKCPSCYEGKNCESERDPCKSSPCQNGGKCISEGNTYICNCTSGYSGLNCKADIGSGGWKLSWNAFLFSLRNKDNLKPFKAPVYKNGGSAIYDSSNYGPTFGDGHDLYIANNAHSSTSSKANFGRTYKPPSGYSPGSSTRALLAGSEYFTPSAVEVFYFG